MLTRRPSSPFTGLGRVSHVVVELGDQPPRYIVRGVTHRRPVERSVSHSVARALSAQGVPLVTRRTATD